MCRHLAYLGPPVAPADLLFEAPHSLSTQAQHPRHQPRHVQNPDGWGAGWWHEGRLRRYRTCTPIWEDTAFDHATCAGAFVASARWASPGSKLDQHAVAPFAADGWLLSLNGLIEGFYDGPRAVLRERCSPPRRSGLVTDTDTELLFALVLDRIDGGESPVDALRALIKEVEAEWTGRFNFLLGNGTHLTATAVGNSLFVRDDPFVIASEPLDEDPAWRPVPDRTVLTADGETIEVEAL